MGNSCNSKSNRNIEGLAVDRQAPDGSWQNADVMAWWKNNDPVAPVDLKRPVCLKRVPAKGHNVYEAAGVDIGSYNPFGTYDLNGSKKAEEKDVDQLIKDHSIFPKAMAYNLPPEEKENPQSRSD